ncbi:MAG: thioredoxin-disulfide reductase [Lachnospiraceae bacterium]|nr:thioredoxin-disulfide reductase [Lachnospiraceae bacterium]
MYDIIIIGSGPAGLSASIYAKRAGFNAITIEKNYMSGGQILDTFEVDNYPGLKGINGFDMGMKFREHADALGCAFKVATVLSVSRNDDIFVVETDEEKLEARAVIAAMGANNAKLSAPGEAEFTGRGVSYCATCDGAFFRGKTTAVVGGGDVAAEDAIFLARGCEKVYLIHRRDELRAADILQKELKSLENVEIIWDTVVEKIEGTDQVERLVLKNKKSGEAGELSVDGVFIAVGIIPNSGILKGVTQLDDKGYVIAGEDCASATPGLFAAGDIRAKQLRQVVTAVADGANAVNSVQEYFLRKNV